jgi:hypothetical protein
MKKITFWKGGEAVGWKRFRPACAKPLRRRQGGNLYAFGFTRTKHMKRFDFIQATISHNLKDPHSKALEPDCLSPFLCDYDTAPMLRGILHRGTVSC